LIPKSIHDLHLRAEAGTNIFVFVVLLFALPVALAGAVGWKYALAFWAVLFAGSGLLKLLGLGF
jgi:hypothetical protein